MFLLEHSSPNSVFINSKLTKSKRKKTASDTAHFSQEVILTENRKTFNKIPLTDDINRFTAMFA